DRTQFNGKNLLNGDFENTKLTFQIGANQGQQLEVNIKEMSAEALDVHEINVMGVQEETEQVEGETVTTPEAPFSFDAEIDKIDKAIKDVSTQRSALGAVQNRLEHTINNHGASAENLTAADSRSRDANLAPEMMVFTDNAMH